jgi:CDP-diacylglycerol--glycerol-3-phosphate 3-phosphatidyltransferase
MRSTIKERARRLLDPLVEVLASAGMSPTGVTVAGLGLAALAGGLVAGGRLRTGALCLILSALCDVLDGQLARRRGRTGAYGAFLDSCIDRLAEGAVFVGLALYLGPHGQRWVLVAILALIGSTMVSYARARAEGLGLHGQVGAMERPERLVLLILALLLGGGWLKFLLLALTVLAFLTFLRRVRHVAAQVQRAAGPPAGGGP